MKQASKPKERVEKPLTVWPALSRAAVQFVEKHPNEVTGIVANALEAAALEAGLVQHKERVLPEALRRLVVARQSESGEGRVLSISEAAELLDVTRATIYAWIESKRLLAWRATRRGVSPGPSCALTAGRSPFSKRGANARGASFSEESWQNGARKLGCIAIQRGYR